MNTLDILTKIVVGFGALMIIYGFCSIIYFVIRAIIEFSKKHKINLALLIIVIFIICLFLIMCYLIGKKILGGLTI